MVRYDKSSADRGARYVEDRRNRKSGGRSEVVVAASSEAGVWLPQRKPTMGQRWELASDARDEVVVTSKAIIAMAGERARYKAGKQLLTSQFQENLADLEAAASLTQEAIARTPSMALAYSEWLGRYEASMAQMDATFTRRLAEKI